jgi:hypothetical protein
MIAGLATDLSLGGFRVQSDVAPPFGTTVMLVARFPEVPHESRLPGTVRWTKPGCFGVEFGSLSARDLSCITALVHGALRSHAHRLREEDSPSSAPPSRVRSTEQHPEPVLPAATGLGSEKKK